MEERILKIEEKDFEFGDETCGMSYSGFVITTNKHIYKIGIDNSQQCCERFDCKAYFSSGYLMTEDEIEDFIGAEFLGIEVVDADKKVYEVFDIYDGEAIFVNIKTSKGVFQIVVYNEHNGYYGHEVKIIKDDKTIREVYL